MKKIKLVAIDIGGTLITDDNKITAKNFETLKKLKLMKIEVALITARMYSSTKYISNLIAADYGVFGNGSNIMNLSNLTTYYTEIISKDLLKELVLFGKKNNMYIHLSEELCETSDENKYFALKHNILNENYPQNLKSNIQVVNNLLDYVNNAQNVVKVIFVTESSNDMSAFIEKFKIKFPNLYICEYNRNLYENAIGQTINYIEVGVKNTTKAEGLKNLLNVLKINHDEILVIGDGDNDIEMFKEFTNSGCLINGTNMAKKYANYISNYTNNESGVSEIIEHYVKRLEKE